MYHPNLLENIIEKVSECYNEIILIKSDQLDNLRIAYENGGNNYPFIYEMQNNHYFFTAEVLKKWEDLIDQISKKIFRDQFSLTYISKELRKYFHTYYGAYDQENLVQFFTYLKDNASDLLFCIPLYGISLSSQELEIGPFSLKSRDKIKIEMLEISPGINVDYLIDLQIPNSNQVLLINKYQTDNEKALEINLTHTNRFIDILNWKFSQITQPAEDIKYIVSLQAPVVEKLSFFSLNNKVTISTHSKILSSTYPLDLNAIEEHITSSEVIWLLRLILEDKINNYHDAILKSIHWFSKFWIEKQSDNKLLYLAIALEALLSEAFATSSFVSDRVAFILGADKEKRLELRDLTKKLYDLRSDIAHGNNINIVKEIDLKQLENITRSIIQYALNNREIFQSLKEFKLSIDNKKYE